MDEKIYIVGHKNPDTDSICAAISLASLKQRLGYKNAIPCRAGKINRETEFVLQAFAMEEPLYIDDLNLKVRDLLNNDEVPTIPINTSLQEAWQVMKKHQQKTLPLIDQRQRLKGIVSIGDLSESYFQSMGELDFGTLDVSIENVVKTLQGKLLVGKAAAKLTGKVYVGAMHYETLESVLNTGCIFLVGDRDAAQGKALEIGVSTLILTGGAILSPELTALARNKGTTVISVEHDTFTAARLLPLSVPAYSIAKTDKVIAFHEDDLLQDVRQDMLQTRFRNYPVLDDHDRVIGMISRYHLLKVARKKVILVDHNEWGQAVSGANQAEILEVIDHHRIGGIQTGEPILFRIEPVGCTCTIITQCYREVGLVPDKAIAGLMLAAIISDTVLFKSPTCTQADIEACAYLEAIAEIDAKAFGAQMFKAASNLSELPVRELIEEDLKMFAIDDFNLAIGQFSVMDLAGVQEIRADLLEDMERMRQEKGLRFILLMATNLIEEYTELFIAGENQANIARAFDKTLNDGSIILPGVLSRKKQVVPILVNYYNN